MDIALLVTEYLKDKSALRDIENDSLNIVNNQIVSWSFTNIPCPTTDELAALQIIIQPRDLEIARVADLKTKGSAARIACQECLDLIAGSNIEKNLTSDQITQMSVTFAPIVQALMSNRPSLAKSLISVVVPDGVIITDQLKTDVLADLVGY